MSRILDSYLDRVMVYVNRSAAEAADIRSELRDHLLTKIADLQSGAMSEADATYQAVSAHGHPRVVGYGLRRGFPWVDVRTHGTARGFIACGPKAVGVIAVGGCAFGVVAIGGVALGAFAFGGFAAALVFVFCGFGVATYAYGGCVLGVIATGGFAVGVVAAGGFAMGLLAKGGQVLSYYDVHTAPPLLKDMARFADQGLFVWAQAVFIAPMMVLLGLSGLLSRREARRIGAADPWLQE